MKTKEAIALAKEMLKKLDALMNKVAYYKPGWAYRLPENTEERLHEEGKRYVYCPDEYSFGKC